MRLSLNSVALCVVLGLAIAAPFLISNLYIMRVVVLAVIFSIFALSLNIVLGYTGLISLGQAAFFGIGAYSVGIISVKTHWTFLVVLVIAMGFGALAGVVVGIPSLRIGGHYLALVTLGFGQIAFVLFVNLRGLTGGYDGLGGIPHPILGVIEFANPFSFYYLALAVLLLSAVGSWLVRTSFLGRAMLSVREDEQMARALGVRATRIKIGSFVACSALAALAGGLYAYFYGYISPDSFTISDSVLVLAMVLIGGRGSVVGVIAGATLLTVMPEFLRFLGDWYQIVYAIMILVVMISFPSGLAGLTSFVYRRLLRKGAK